MDEVARDDASITVSRSGWRAVLLVIFVCGFGAVTAQTQTAGFVELLDADLSRWTVVDAQSGTFVWQDGVLHVTGPDGWLRSDRRYGDFDAEVEFRFLTEDADSGFFFRAIGNEPFLRGWPNEAYQLQMRNPEGESRFPPLGGLFRHGMPDATTQFDEQRAREVTLPAGQWQRLSLTVSAQRVTAAINGTQILEAAGIGNGTGYIGLQGETPALEFRSVRIREHD